MKKNRTLKNTVKNQRGQGMLEYVLLLAIVVAAIVAFKGPIMKFFGDATTKVTGDATNALQ